MMPNATTIPASNYLGTVGKYIVGALDKLNKGWPHLWRSGHFACQVTTWWMESVNYLHQNRYIATKPHAYSHHSHTKKWNVTHCFLRRGVNAAHEDSTSVIYTLISFSSSLNFSLVSEKGALMDSLRAVGKWALSMLFAEMSSGFAIQALTHFEKLFMNLSLSASSLLNNPPKYSNDSPSSLVSSSSKQSSPSISTWFPAIVTDLHSNQE